MRTRREVLKTAAAAAIAAIAARGQHSHSGAELVRAQGPYTPKALKPEQMESVAKLVDLIIPRTDTPGASDAGVPVFIDRALSRNTRAKARFLAGMAQFDESCRRQHGSGFAALGVEQQNRMLASISGGKFFKQVKDLTIDGYYTSKAGLTVELGWDANTFLSEFKGCTHPEHQI